MSRVCKLCKHYYNSMDICKPIEFCRQWMSFNTCCCLQYATPF